MSKPLRTNDTRTLTPIEAVLLRPFMYIGSINEESIEQYIYENNSLVLKELPTIPGLLKIFDEIISNSLDEAIRTKFKYATKIRVEYDTNTYEVKIKDNGRGLPIEFDKETNKWTPEELFTALHSGSNFEDDDPEKGLVVGMNGLGSTLTNIFSKKFSVDTCNGSKHYKQTFENHIAIKRKPTIVDSKDNYTEISYIPNYDFFKVSEEVKQNLSTLYEKRIRDIAFAYPEITFYYQKQKIAIPNLKSFVKSIHEVSECTENDNGRLAIFYSDTEFQQMSNVNGADTYKGGTHVDYATSKIVEHIRTFLKKKHKLEVKPVDVKQKLFLLLSIRMSNPQFENQVKNELKSKEGFKDLVDSLLTKKFLDSICKNEEIILPIVETYKLKLQVKDNLELKKLNQNKKKVRVDKYYPAVKEQKYMLLCEGDSATGGIMAALGRDVYSYFSLKGKPLNSLEVDIAKMKTNEELKNIITILNLNLGSDKQDINHSMIVPATDADADGNHILALLLAFFKRFTPNLVKEGKVGYLRTPLLFAKKKDKIVKYFFTMEEYQTWETANHNHGLKFNYVKGLGTWESNDLKLLFKEFGIEHFIKKFEYDDTSFDQIDNWMSSRCVEFRKNALRGREFNLSSI